MLCNNCLHTISFQEKYPNYWYYHFFFCNFPRTYSIYFLLKQNNIFISLEIRLKKLHFSLKLERCYCTQLMTDIHIFLLLTVQQLQLIYTLILFSHREYFFWKRRESLKNFFCNSAFMMTQDCKLIL